MYKHLSLYFGQDGLAPTDTGHRSIGLERFAAGVPDHCGQLSGAAVLVPRAQLA